MAKSFQIGDILWLNKRRYRILCEEKRSFRLKCLLTGKLHTMSANQIHRVQRIDSTMPSMNKPCTALPRWGMYVWTSSGILMGAAMLNSGAKDCTSFEVSEPISQEFLDDVNAALKTSFVFVGATNTGKFQRTSEQAQT